MISSVWKLEVSVGDIVAPEEVLVILEAMKMEIAVRAPSTNAKFRVESILRETGERVEAGDVLMLLKKLPVE